MRIERMDVMDARGPSKTDAERHGIANYARATVHFATKRLTD